MGNKITIKGYNIKLYDKYNNFVATIKEDKLKNKIKISETINGGQGELELVLDKDGYDTLNISDGLNISDVFCVKVFFVIDIEGVQSEEHLYTGIKSNIIRTVNGDGRETIMRFYGLYSFLGQRNHFRISGEELQSSYEQEGDNSDFILGNVMFSALFTEVDIYDPLGNINFFTIGMQIKTVDNTVAGYIMYINKTDKRIGIYDQTGKFPLNTTLHAISGLNTYSFQITDYRIGDNVANYFLDYLNSSVVDSGSNYKVAVSGQSNNDTINQILKLNEGYYYFMGKDGILHFKPLNTPSLSKTLTMDKEVMEIEETLDYSEIKNFITISNGSDIELSVYDIDSIEKYGRQDMYETDSKLLNTATVAYKAEKYLTQKKQPKQEVMLKVNLQNYINSSIFWKWNEMLGDWSVYTMNWQDLKDTVEGGSIFNINIGDRISVRNLDNNNVITDLTVVRKEFSGEFLTMYLGNYTRNFVIQLGN